jgi:hypothetical protein
MRDKQQRSALPTGGVDVSAETLLFTADPATRPAPNQDPEAAGRPTEAAVPIRERLLWSWDDVAALTTMSRRLLEREVAAGRMPPPDVRIGRRACYRPTTIMTWLDSLADRHGRRSRP